MYSRMNAWRRRRSQVRADIRGGWEHQRSGWGFGTYSPYLQPGNYSAVLQQGSDGKKRRSREWIRNPDAVRLSEHLKTT